MSTERNIINDLEKIIQSIERFQTTYGDEPYCNAFINDAKQKLNEALRSNEHEYLQAVREAAEERRTQRAEDGHPE